MFTASKRIIGLVGFAGSLFAGFNAPTMFGTTTDKSIPQRVSYRPFSLEARDCTVCATAWRFPKRSRPLAALATRTVLRNRGDEKPKDRSLQLTEETSSPDPREVREAESAVRMSSFEKAPFTFYTALTSKTGTIAEHAKSRRCAPEVVARLNALRPATIVSKDKELIYYSGCVRRYGVRCGDSLWEIRQRTGVPIEAICYLNGLHSTKIHPGQLLYLPLGILSTAERKRIRAVSWVARLLIPSNYVYRPVRGRISSHFGWRQHPVLKRRGFHTGIDISAPYGTPIRAVADGTIRLARYCGSLGLAVSIRHDRRGSLSIYGHCSKLLVKRKEKVHAGQVIALVGRSGRTTGCHLHYGLKRDGHYVNPGRHMDLCKPFPAKARFARR